MGDGRDLKSGRKKSGGQEERRRDVLMFCLSLFLSFFVFSREKFDH